MVEEAKSLSSLHRIKIPLPFLLRIIKYLSAYVHGGRGQVGVLVFQLAVQGQSTFVSVVGQQGGQVEHFAESRLTRLDWKAFPVEKKEKKSEQSEQTVRKQVIFFFYI
jgi:hypothetical protein